MSGQRVPCRPWTVKEVREAARLRGEGFTLPKIAERLGRSAGSVSVALSRAGLAGPPGKPFTPGEDSRLRDLLAAGWGWTAAARRLGRGPDVVRRRAVRLGLRLDRESPAFRSGVSAPARKALETEYGSVGEANAMRNRVAAAAMGWPRAGTVTAARVCEALRDNPWQPRLALVARTGCSRTAVTDALPRLLGEGLVVRVKGRGGHYLYSLSPGVTKGGRRDRGRVNGRPRPAGAKPTPCRTGSSSCFSPSE